MCVARRRAISERKIMPTIVRTVKARLWRSWGRMLEREEGE